MKLALAVTLGGMQGLGTTQDSRERPVDRLGALAMAQRGERAAQESLMACLGGRIVGLKWSRRADLRGDVEDLLAIVLGWDRWSLNLGPRVRTKISRWAVTEYTLPVCLTCRGAKEAPNHKDVEGTQPMVICGGCGGSGLRRYTDSERIEAMGKPYPEAMSVAHQVLATSEALAVRGCAEMLERW